MKLNKRIPYFKYVPIIIITLFLIKIINQTDFTFKGIEIILKIITPIFYGFAIAYLLNPAMNFLIKNFSLGVKLSIFIVYSSFIVLIVVSIGFIIPIVIKSLGDLTLQIPNYINEITEITKKYNDAFKDFNLGKVILDNVSTLGNELKNYFGSFISSGFSAVAVTAQAFFIISVSVLLSIYFLSNKNEFKNYMLKVLFAFFKKETVENILEYASEIHIVFSQYINGKLLESLILSIIASLGLSIIKVPYSILMGIIIGLTNLIPYIGPFIGMAPPVIIALFNNPWSALIVIIFLLALQQVQNLWFGPKILGNKVGLSPVGVIISIIIGSALLGIVGMLISIPIFAFIKVTFNKYMMKRLSIKGIDM